AQHEPVLRRGLSGRGGAPIGMTRPIVSAPTLPAPLRTPLMKSVGCLVKLEVKQWTGSAKYRMVYAKVQEAIREGRITADSTLVEATSGSTGVALAYAGRMLGLPVELHALSSITPAKRERILSFGAQLIVHPAGTPVSALLEALRDKVQMEQGWHLGQFDRNPLLPSYRKLGAELLEQLQEEKQGPPEALACPVGTGGLIQGVGSLLREAFPGIRIIAVEPRAGISIDGIRNTDELHLGERDPYDRSFPDEVLRVDRPSCPCFVRGIPLGESASAMMNGLRPRKGMKILMIAPD